MRIKTLYKKSGMEEQTKRDSKETKNGQLQKRQLPEEEIEEAKQGILGRTTLLREPGFSEKSWAARR